MSFTVNMPHRRAITACGLFAAIASTAYVATASLALADGPDRIEIPALVNTIFAVSVSASTILAVGGWLIERVIAAAIPALATRIVHEMDATIEVRAHAVVESTSARNAAQLREIVTGEIMADVINAAVGRAHRAGMVLQAQATPPRGASVVKMSNRSES